LCNHDASAGIQKRPLCGVSFAVESPRGDELTRRIGEA